MARFTSTVTNPTATGTTSVGAGTGGRTPRDMDEALRRNREAALQEERVRQMQAQREHMATMASPNYAQVLARHQAGRDRENAVAEQSGLSELSDRLQEEHPPPLFLSNYEFDDEIGRASCRERV